MAKSKKKKKADFQKVKLKVGKKLSKGDNVTNLSFKTRQIQLTQSIRTGDTSLPVTRRNLSIQDLLRHCDHHSVGARVNAIAGIKELMLNNFDEFLIPSNVHGYGTVMKKLSSMLIDNESDVRHFVINLFKLIFTKLKVASQKMNTDNLMSGSLFSHIHAYLCCAMNHIHEDIRLDSLVLFDSLLDAFPTAMVQQTGDLMKNLIGMISAPISIGAKGNTVTQRLSMNPDSKLPVMKFRARVLLRIKLTLKVALLELTDVNFTYVKNTKAVIEPVWSLFFDAKCEGTKQNTLLVSQEHKQKFALILKGTPSDMQDYIMKPSSLEEFIKLSIPILLQCWKEARASGQNDTSAGNVISLDALEVMSLVVSVIELLFSLSVSSGQRNSESHSKSQMIQTSFLIENYETSFAQDFMSHFPYSAQIEVKQSKKKKTKGQKSADLPNTQSSLAALNLCMCHIMSHFCTGHTFGKERSWMNKIQQFVIKSFNASPSPEHCRLLIQILRNLFQNPSLQGPFSSALEAACKCYSACKVKLPQKRDLFKLLFFVFKQWDGWKGKLSNHEFYGRYSYSENMERILCKFVKSLPRLLLLIWRTNSTDIEWVTDVLSCITCSLNGYSALSLTEEMDACFSDILGLLRIGNEDVQQKLLSLLAMGPALTKDQLKLILMAIRRPVAGPTLPHRKSRSLACQAVTCTSLGIRRNIPLSNQVEFNQMTQAQSDSLSDYLKFMFSLLIGLNREELDTLSPTDATSLLPWKTVDYTLEKEQWARHMDIATNVCQEVVHLQIPASPSDGYHQPFTFISNLEKLWKHTLVKYTDVHMMSAFSLFKFISFTSLNHICEKPSSELYEMTASIMACVLTSFYLPSTKTETLNKVVVEQMKTEVITCLHSATLLLPDLWNTLKNAGFSGATDEQTQAAANAMEFLLSDDSLKTRMQNENLLESAEPEAMDVAE